MHRVSDDQKSKGPVTVKMMVILRTPKQSCNLCNVRSTSLTNSQICQKCPTGTLRAFDAICDSQTYPSTRCMILQCTAYTRRLLSKKGDILRIHSLWLLGRRSALSSCSAFSTYQNLLTISMESKRDEYRLCLNRVSDNQANILNDILLRKRIMSTISTSEV